MSRKFCGSVDGLGTGKMMYLETLWLSKVA